MADHDNGYKLLFSHAETVADFLRGFVKEDWVRELDFSTLTRVDETFVSDDVRSRESDVVWRVSWRGGPLYVYLLLEFQSTVDPYMAVRVMTYLGLLYQDLIRQKALPFRPARAHARAGNRAARDLPNAGRPARSGRPQFHDRFSRPSSRAIHRR